MSIAAQDIEHLAKLARLRIECAEYPALINKLNTLIALVDTMNTLDTDDLPPLTHPLDIHASFRGDVITETNPLNLDQTLTAHIDAQGAYLVPSVLEE